MQIHRHCHHFKVVASSNSSWKPPPGAGGQLSRAKDEIKRLERANRTFARFDPKSGGRGSFHSLSSSLQLLAANRNTLNQRERERESSLG